MYETEILQKIMINLPRSLTLTSSLIAVHDWRSSPIRLSLEKRLITRGDLLLTPISKIEPLEYIDRSLALTPTWSEGT